MRLYTGQSREFIEKVRANNLADELTKTFTNYYGHKPGTSEINSWNNSLMFLKDRLSEQQLLDAMVLLEYELPYTSKRIDCVLLGQDAANTDNVVIIELKQWSSVEPCDIEDNVITFTGHANRMVAHPSIQAQGYHMLLKDFVRFFETNP